MAAALSTMSPPVRVGTGTVLSGTRFPAPTAIRASIDTNPTARSATTTARLKKGCLLHHNGLLPVSMEQDLRALHVGGSQQTRARLEELAEGARPETNSNLRHAGGHAQHSSRQPW